MPEKSFVCTVVTPEAELLNEPCAYASIPAWDGLFGVLPRRAPILARLGTGELALRLVEPGEQGGERSYFVDGGFVKMAGDHLTVLAERAVAGEHLSESDARAELAEAEARTVPDDADDVATERDAIRHAVRAAKVKLRMAQNSKKRGI